MKNNSKINSKINSTSGWGKLTKISKEQFEKRITNLPENTRQKFILDIREQYLYKNPENVAKDFAKDMGIDEKTVLTIRNAEDLKKVAEFVILIPLIKDLT